MKPAFIAAILLAATVSLSPRGQSKQRAPDIAAPAQNKNPTMVPPAVESQKRPANTTPGNNQPPKGDAAAQWILVVVTAVTALFIGWQAWETRRAATATKKSVGAIQQQTGVLERQAKATEDAAKAASKSADLTEKGLLLLNRSYLAITDWSIPGPILGQNEKLEIRFSVLNPSNTPARIEAIEFSKPKESVVPMGYMLTPGEKKPVSVEVENVRSEEKVLVAGRIIYKDIFRKIRHRKFAQLCWCRPGYPVFGAPNIVGLNDEEEWDKEEDENPN